MFLDMSAHVHRPMGHLWRINKTTSCSVVPHTENNPANIFSRTCVLNSKVKTSICRWLSGLRRLMASWAWRQANSPPPISKSWQLFERMKSNYTICILFIQLCIYGRHCCFIVTVHVGAIYLQEFSTTLPLKCSSTSFWCYPQSCTPKRLEIRKKISSRYVWLHTNKNGHVLVYNFNKHQLTSFHLWTPNSNKFT